MLQLEHIRKAYVTAGFTQVALDDVSVAFRDNEFVAILGTSGSGKTTMLNILGGLDHADAGDIIINGISTKHYSDKDWDTYRNHRIGFIFQSYNLIPHQTVLSNVELALTLSGIGRAERRERAREALVRVGLGDHINKRPSQLSGGQMQRVAIARALVNDPDIVLADEPTGALDTETGIQVMDILKEIADERLVIMVTHNPDLAEQYATRIVRLKDGRIVGDTDPILDAAAQETADRAQGAATGVLPVISARHAREGGSGSDATTGHAERTGSDKDAHHASMSFLTALSLSFNNLMTKKGRTFMTAFAGSIGIIGIAAILALSNGVNNYIAQTEEDALSSYPLTITKSSFDLTSMMVASAAAGDEGAAEAAEASAEPEPEAEQDEDVINEYAIMSNMFARVKNNDLAKFKEFLESDRSGVEPYVNTIQYSYSLTPQIYAADMSGGAVRLSPSRMSQTMTNGLSGSAFTGGTTASSFQELMDDQRLLESQMDVVAGRWPEAYDEAVFVTTSNGAVSDYTLYSLGVHDIKVMDEMVTRALNGSEVDVPAQDESFRFTNEDALKLHFKVVPAVYLYQKNAEQGTWTDMTGDKAFMKQVIDSAIDLKVVGVVRRSEDAATSLLSEGVAYSPLLTRHLMEVSGSSQIVQEQLAHPEVDVFTGKTFEELQNDEQNEFDMDSMFTIDEDALQRAFTFDTSALNNLGSGIDLSGLDLSSMGDAFDFSDFSIDPSAATSVFNEETMRKLMASAPQFDLSSLGYNFDTLPDDLASVQNALTAVTDAVNALLANHGISPEELQGLQSALALVQSVTQKLQEGQIPTAEELQGLQAALVTITTELQKISASQSLSEEEMASLQAALATAQEELQKVQLGGLITDEAKQAFETASDELTSGFLAWIVAPVEEGGHGGSMDELTGTGFADLFGAYLQTEGAQAILTKMGEGIGSDLQERFTAAMSSYMEDQFAPWFSAQMQTLVTQAAEAITLQIAQQLQAQMTAAAGKMGTQLSETLSSELTKQFSSLSTAMENAFSFDATTFANAIQFNMTQEDLASLLSKYMNADELSYDANLNTLGYAQESDPDSISIYPKDFPSKEAVLEIIDAYNDERIAANDDESTISYTDIAGVLMSSVTDIVNTISLVLIAFVSISLVVSSIMIAIITYISVLERKKEIGILRAMGASKLNVANVFNAETVIEGFIAGVLAILVVYIASVPVNAIVLETHNVPNIMSLPWDNALTLVAISVVLTLVAGLIPSSAAARRDPVEALRSE